MWSYDLCLKQLKKKSWGVINWNWKYKQTNKQKIQFHINAFYSSAALLNMSFSSEWLSGADLLLFLWHSDFLLQLRSVEVFVWQHITVAASPSTVSCSHAKTSTWYSALLICMYPEGAPMNHNSSLSPFEFNEF